MPPWGRPVTGGSPWPSVSSTPALSHVRMSPRQGRSAMRSRNLAINRA